MIGKIFPALDGKIDGSSFRVPVITGSIVDLAVDVGRTVSADEANAHFRDAADSGDQTPTTLAEPA